MSLFRHRQWYIFTIISITCTSMYAEDTMRDVPTDQFTLAYQELIQAVTDLTNSPTPPTLTTLQAIADVAAFGATHASLSNDAAALIAQSVIPAALQCLNNATFNPSDIQGPINTILSSTNTILHNTSTNTSLASHLLININTPMDTLLTKINQSYSSIDITSNQTTYNTLATSITTNFTQAHAIPNAKSMISLQPFSISGANYLEGIYPSSATGNRINRIPLDGSTATNRSLGNAFGLAQAATIDPSYNWWYTSIKSTGSGAINGYRPTNVSETIKDFLAQFITNPVYTSSGTTRMIFALSNATGQVIAVPGTPTSGVYIWTQKTLNFTGANSQTSMNTLISSNSTLWTANTTGPTTPLYKITIRYNTGNSIPTGIAAWDSISLPQAAQGQTLKFLSKDRQDFPVIITNPCAGYNSIIYVLNYDGSVYKSYDLGDVTIAPVFTTDSNNNYWIFINNTTLVHIKTSTNAVTHYNLSSLITQVTSGSTITAKQLTVDANNNPWLSCNEADYLFTVTLN